VLGRLRPPNPGGLDELGPGLESRFWRGQAGEVEPDIPGMWQCGHYPSCSNGGGEVGQQDWTGLLFPLLGQVGF